MRFSDSFLILRYVIQSSPRSVAWHGKTPGNPLDPHVKSFGHEIRRCEISVIISWYVSGLSLVMPLGRIFSTPSGRIQSRSVSRLELLR